MRENIWLRNIIFVLFQPLIPPVGILPTVIHEGAHYVAAIIAGVPISQIKVGWYGLGPGVSIPSSIPEKYWALFFYSGGLFSALVLLVIYFLYFLRLYSRHPTTTNWMMGAAVALSFYIQLSMGILEGIYHENYPLHLNDLWMIGGGLLAVAVHTLVFYLVFLRRRHSASLQAGQQQD